MEMTTIQLRKLTASSGMVLTNGAIYCKEVYLGVNDDQSNWSEITDAEYEIIQQEQFAADDMAADV